MKANEQMYLLNNLQSLLEEQIEMARSSNFRRVEALAEQAGSVVGKIVRTGAFEQAGARDRREHLTKLYGKLELILAAGKNSVAGQLKQVGDVRKTLRTYRSSG